jgi:hypothetical protein
VYTISTRMRDPGKFSLHLTLMWETRRLAFAPDLGEEADVEAFLDISTAYAKARQHVAPLCRPFLRAVKGSGNDASSALLTVQVLPPCCRSLTHWH